MVQKSTLNIQPLTPTHTKAIIALLNHDQQNYHKEDTDLQYYWQKFAYRSHDNEILIARNDFTKDLILERILICHKHIGTGTKIIKALEELALRLNFKTVTIQSIISDEMWNLAYKQGYIKNGFDAVKTLKKMR